MNNQSTQRICDELSNLLNLPGGALLCSNDSEKNSIFHIQQMKKFTQPILSTTGCFWRYFPIQTTGEQSTYNWGTKNSSNFDSPRSRTYDLYNKNSNII